MMSEFHSPKKSPRFQTQSPKSPNRVEVLKTEIKNAKNQLNDLKNYVQSKKKTVQNKENNLLHDPEYFNLPSSEKIKYLQRFVPAAIQNSHIQSEISKTKEEIIKISQESSLKRDFSKFIFDEINNTFEKSYYSAIYDQLLKMNQKIMYYEDIISQINPYMMELENELQTLTLNASDLKEKILEIQEKSIYFKEMLNTPVPCFNALEILVSSIEKRNAKYSSIQFEDFMEIKSDYIGIIEASNSARREHLEARKNPPELKSNIIISSQNEIIEKESYKMPKLDIQNKLIEHLENITTHYYDYEMDTDTLFHNFVNEKKNKSDELASKMNRITNLKKELEEIDKINEEIDKYQDLIIDEKDNLAEINKYSNDIQKRPISDVPLFSPKSPRSNRRIDIKRRKIRRSEEVLQHKSAEIQKLKNDIQNLEKECLLIQERIHSYNTKTIEE